MSIKQARHASRRWNFSVYQEGSTTRTNIIMQYFKTIMNAKIHSEQNIKICIQRISITDFLSCLTLPYSLAHGDSNWVTATGSLPPILLLKAWCLRWGSKPPTPAQTYTQQPVVSRRDCWFCSLLPHQHIIASSAACINEWMNELHSRDTNKVTKKIF